MLDSVLNVAEGLFLMVCAVRLTGKAKGVFLWTLAVLWMFQGVFTVAWGLWHDNETWQRLNNMMPQYLEIAAFFWLWFYARFLRKPSSVA